MCSTHTKRAVRIMSTISITRANVCGSFENVDHHSLRTHDHFPVVTICTKSCSFSSLPSLVLALVVRNGTELRPLRVDDGYDFNYQQYQKVTNPRNEGRVVRIMSTMKISRARVHVRVHVRADSPNYFLFVALSCACPSRQEWHRIAPVARGRRLRLQLPAVSVVRRTHVYGKPNIEMSSRREAPSFKISFPSLPFLVLVLVVRNGTELRPLRVNDGYDFNYQ